MDVEELIARQEITDVLHRYCRAVDRQDPDLLRSVYHPDATDDHGVYSGPVDGLVAFMLNDGLEMIHHAISNIVIERDGDVAKVECYLDRVERRDGEWRIAHRHVVYDWGRIEPATQAWWDTLPGNWTFGSRDRDDPDYTEGPWPWPRPQETA
jgi:hypothetical protein